MRCRAAISRWVYEKGKSDNVVEMIDRNGKVYVRINDYQKVGVLFGRMLAEVERINSEGDFESGMNLIESYGVRVKGIVIDYVDDFLGQMTYYGRNYSFLPDRN